MILSFNFMYSGLKHQTPKAETVGLQQYTGHLDNFLMYHYLHIFGSSITDQKLITRGVTWLSTIIMNWGSQHISSGWVDQPISNIVKITIQTVHLLSELVQRVCHSTLSFIYFFNWCILRIIMLISIEKHEIILTIFNSL